MRLGWHYVVVIARIRSTCVMRGNRHRENARQMSARGCRISTFIARTFFALRAHNPVAVVGDVEFSFAEKRPLTFRGRCWNFHASNLHLEIYDHDSVGAFKLYLTLSTRRLFFFFLVMAFFSLSHLKLSLGKKTSLKYWISEG